MHLKPPSALYSPALHAYFPGNTKASGGHSLNVPLHKPTNPHLHPSFPPVPSDLNKGGVFLFPSKPILSFCPHHPLMPTLLTILLFLCVSSSQHESPRPRPHSPPVDHLYLAFCHKLLERVARHQYSVSSSSATHFFFSSGQVLDLHSHSTPATDPSGLLLQCTLSALILLTSIVTFNLSFLFKL